MAGTVFATTLQTLRKQRGVTQEQLATHLGVSPQAVSKWENGSYPDGDLLPQIADYFEVSIDYLYGRAKDTVSVEQQIIDAMLSINVNEKFEHYEHFEKVFRYLWAAQISFWPQNKTYYDRPTSESDHVTASTVIDNAGFDFIRLNNGLEFYTIMKEPEGGFASFFKVTDRLAELFSVLGKKDNLKVLFYMLSLANGEGVSVATIAKRIGVSEKTAEEMMEFLVKMSGDNHGNNMVQKLSVLNEHDQTEPLYMVEKCTLSAVLMLLAGADSMLNPPNSFSFAVGGREKAFFERDKLDFLQKPAKK